MVIQGNLDALQPLYAPWEEPSKHRVKDEGIKPGRRPSRCALVPYVRAQVSDWRRTGYEGASETTKTLLRYWFDTAHENGFRYHFCQREAIECIVWLYEVKQYRIPSDLFTSLLPEEHPYYVSLTNVRPEEDQWARYASKLATGAGKTKCMSLLIAWSYFHSIYEPDSDLARHFVVVAPNLIVFERLRDDFEGARIFYQDPVLPPEYRDAFNVQVVMQDDAGGGSYRGSIYLTNIHRLFRDGSSPENTENSGSLLGPEVNRGQVFRVGEVLRTRISEHPSVIVLNDEAHHLHDPESAWNEAIAAIHKQSITKGNRGVILQSDFSATPKHNNGDLFRHVISDFPLGEAVDAGIVKVPVIGRSEEIKADLTASDGFDKYRTHLLLGYKQYEYAYEEWEETHKPILFVMCENATAATQIAKQLNDDERFPLLKGKVLDLHTRLEGRVVTRKVGKQEFKEFVYSETKIKDDDLKEIRRWSADLDKPNSPYRCVVSVLMLREGWDVRNVTTIVPLRPYTAKSNILAEQTLGRGLRRMTPAGLDGVYERVTVVEHPAFTKFYEEELEQEGLDIGIVDLDGPKPQSVPIFPDFKNKPVEELDIVIPRVSDSIESTVTLGNIEFEEIIKQFRQVTDKPLPIGKAKEGTFTFEERTLFTDEVVKTYEIDRGLLAQGFSAISVFVKVLERACRLQSTNQVLAPLIQRFIEEILFERPVSLFSGEVDHRMSELDVRECIEATFAPLIKKRTNTKKDRKRESQAIDLSSWKAFQATNSKTRPCVPSKRSLFNLTPCGNYFEAGFAGFCDDADDVLSFAKNAGPQKLAIDYLHPSGRPALYWPDFFVKLANGKMLLVETKGEEDATVPYKTRAAMEWCKAATSSGTAWEYVYVPEYLFQQNSDLSLESLARACAIKRKALLEMLTTGQVPLPLEATAEETIKERTESFLAGIEWQTLPGSLQDSVKHAVNLLDYDMKMKSPQYGAAFQPLLNPLEELSGMILTQKVLPNVPQSPDLRDAYFDPYVSSSDKKLVTLLQTQGRHLKRNVVFNGFSNRLGNFLFCLDYAWNPRFQGLTGLQVWDDVKTAFSDPDLQYIHAELSEVNSFRGRHIAHGENPLIDVQSAQKALKQWIQCIVEMFNVAK